jgi:hypothetical protein
MCAAWSNQVKAHIAAASDRNFARWKAALADPLYPTWRAQWDATIAQLQASACDCWPWLCQQPALLLSQAHADALHISTPAVLLQFAAVDYQSCAIGALWNYRYHTSRRN